MARAYAAPQHTDYGSDQGGDWQTLRNELVALLDQVEGQAVRARTDERYDGIAERMRDLRHQIIETEPDTRQREALRSVRRAVERFSDRDDYQGGFAAARGGNPRDTLESAIRQIRGRHAELSGDYREPGARNFVPEAPRAAEAPRVDGLAQAISGISGRLERLEGELRGASRIQTGNVKEIAEQVAQLSHVVELLAGAVGETGQVKRLETQIASLAALLAQGPRVDLTMLTTRLDDLASTVGRALDRDPSDDAVAVSQRLDDVSATMGRLADLQVEFANRVDFAAQSSAGQKDSLRSIEGAMHAIEDGVRNVYDRIDAIEKSQALPPSALDRVTEELARVAESLQAPPSADGLSQLSQLVEGLSDRVSGLQSPNIDVSDLKLDMEALRTTVSEALEPRFAAIEMQIEALNERVATTPLPDVGVGHLEAQVRQLVARMDQTGEQLTGLAGLYGKPAEAMPDLEALAEMVASRTSEAITQASSPGPPSLSGSDIDEIERRVSRLVAAGPRRSDADDLAGIETSINAVNERLARLEDSLRALDTGPSVTAEPIPSPPAAPERETDTTADPIAGLLDEAVGAATLEAGGAPRQNRDAMPANPAVEAPLRDRPFGADLGAVKAALEAHNGLSRQHPGLSGDLSRLEAEDRLEPARSPEDDKVVSERPPRPVSSFERPDAGQGGDDTPAFHASPAPAADDDPAPVPSTNTFIAAARRAAVRQQTASSGAASGSLIAKAFASFHSVRGEAPAADVPPAPTAAETPKKKGGLRRLLAGDKKPRSRWTPPDEAPFEPALPKPLEQESAAELEVAVDRQDPPRDLPERESFLSRHRRPILLAASLVAIAFLTLNLINQRLAAPAEQAPEAPPTSSAGADVSDARTALPLSAEPIAAAANSVSGPRVIPIVDSLSTASIDPAAAKGFTPARPAAVEPAAFSASAARSSAATDAIETASITPSSTSFTPLDEFESPVRVDMPPAALGPEALRAAAANGDARAQFEIAAIYTEGRAVSENLEAAAVWYERSAAQGFAPAQYRLGNLYENGKGVERDLQQARLWYQRAAEAGNRMAMHNLAALYASGELGKQQFDSAAEWFEQAARRGMRDSQFNLGMLYARGLGVPQDFEASYRWFSLATLRGDQDAGKARDEVARSLDAATVSRLNDELAGFDGDDVDLIANFRPDRNLECRLRSGRDHRNP